VKESLKTPGIDYVLSAHVVASDVQWPHKQPKRSGVSGVVKISSQAVPSGMF
jgi:hypothetical protein